MNSTNPLTPQPLYLREMATKEKISERYRLCLKKAEDIFS